MIYVVGHSLFKENTISITLLDMICVEIFTPVEDTNLLTNTYDAVIITFPVYTRAMVGYLLS